MVTLLELEMGIGLIERRDVAQAALLRTWLNHHVLPTFDGRIIVIDVATALCCVVLCCVVLCCVVLWSVTCTRPAFRP